MAKGAAKTKAEKPTPVSEWKKVDDAELVDLPSGKRAKLRRPRTFGLIRRDEIPNPLMSLVMEIAQGIAPEEGESERKASDYVAYMHWLASRAFVEPRLFWSEDPEERAPEDWDGIEFENLDDADLMFVVSWSEMIDETAVGRMMEDLKPFPAESASDPDGGSGADIRPETVGAT